MLLFSGISVLVIWKFINYIYRIPLPLPNLSLLRYFFNSNRRHPILEMISSSTAS